MGVFLRALEEYEEIGVISVSQLAYYMGKYENLDSENKVLYDKHKDLILDKVLQKNSDLNTKVSAIKSNVQFLAWVVIVNLIGLLYISYNII